MTCEKDHSGDLPRGPIIALEESQAGFWRHKCAGCAYEMGKRDAGDTADRHPSGAMGSLSPTT